MLVLAVDTATPAVTAGIVVLYANGSRVLASRAIIDSRAAGELLTPCVLEIAQETGIALGELDAVVCGVGPGPFTGLRAGMVTAAALGHALTKPVYPVSSLSGIAADVAHPGGLVVATDARRREVYWACYDNRGNALIDPQVTQPGQLAAQLKEELAEHHITHAAGHGARIYADVLQLPLLDKDYPTPLGLVTAISTELLAGNEPGPLTPLYLRRPDAVEPMARKRVSAL